jgi:hypothetical protein
VIGYIFPELFALSRHSSFDARHAVEAGARALEALVSLVNLGDHTAWVYRQTEFRVLRVLVPGRAQDSPEEPGVTRRYLPEERRVTGGCKKSVPPTMTVASKYTVTFEHWQAQLSNDVSVQPLDPPFGYGEAFCHHP